jgi:hypothetical protein
VIHTGAHADGFERFLGALNAFVRSDASIDQG